jgi:Xaa-Pro aminopeptidase
MIKMIYANTRNSDMFYAVKMKIPDAFFYIETDKKSYVFLDHRELKVFEEKNKNKNIEAVLLNDFIEKVEKIENKIPINHKLAELLLKKFSQKNEEIQVPNSFPLDLADFLKSRGFGIKPILDFFSKRIIKDIEEIKEIKKSIKLNRLAFKRIEKILTDSVIKEDKIFYKDKILTSEFLKQEVELLLFKKGMIAPEGIIVSSGEQAVIPHHSGSGPIKPHQTIICDIFPKNRESGYYADMTRTYSKGKPSEKVQKIYKTVLKAQETAIKKIKPGIKASEIHQVCVDIFLKAGYDVGNKGFVHNTGHGIGIDIHEKPYLSKSSEDVLRKGMIFTVEPGLYYSGLGGVRIEDDVLVTEKGCENLTNYPKQFIIE